MLNKMVTVFINNTKLYVDEPVIQAKSKSSSLSISNTDMNNTHLHQQQST